MLIPQPDPLDEFIPALASMVAKTSWLPNPTVVATLARAVFPTARSKSGRQRFATIPGNGSGVGMYDDNTTPAWVIFWAHGLNGTRPKGWTIAHVWPTSDDISAYTHLANLAMVCEPFASLTDKNGPLTGLLRWHAWDVYHWKPEGQAEPREPAGCDDIHWRYLRDVADPKVLIRHRLDESNDRRSRILRPIMESRQML